MKNKKMILAECEATLSNGAEPNKNISRTEFCKKLDFAKIQKSAKSAYNLI